jgi:hypothetical protein
MKRTDYDRDGLVNPFVVVVVVDDEVFFGAMERLGVVMISRFFFQLPP